MVAADVHATGHIHDERPHPAGLQSAADNLNTSQEAVVLIQNKNLFHRGQIYSRRGDFDLIVGHRPRVEAIDGTGNIVRKHLARIKAHTRVETGNLECVLPIEIRPARAQVVIEADVAVGHLKQITCLDRRQKRPGFARHSQQQPKTTGPKPRRDSLINTLHLNLLYLHSEKLLRPGDRVRVGTGYTEEIIVRT